MLLLNNLYFVLMIKKILYDLKERKAYHLKSTTQCMNAWTHGRIDAWTQRTARCCCLVVGMDKQVCLTFLLIISPRSTFDHASLALLTSFLLLLYALHLHPSLLLSYNNNIGVIINLNTCEVECWWESIRDMREYFTTIS